MKSLKLGIVFVITLSLVACGGGDGTNQDTQMTEDVPFETSYVVEIQDGDKVFDPETRTVKGNTGTIMIDNTLDAPHGFKISELNIEEEVEANSELTVDVGSVEPGEYTVDCQLHSAHKHGKLIVESP